MIEYFVRTEPLGTDRANNRYWMFEGDDRLFVEMRTTHRNDGANEATATDDDDLWQKPSDSQFDDDDAEESFKDAARTALQRLIQTKANSTVQVEWFVYSHPMVRQRPACVAGKGSADIADSCLFYWWVFTGAQTVMRSARRPRSAGKGIERGNQGSVRH